MGRLLPRRWSQSQSGACSAVVGSGRGPQDVSQDVLRLLPQSPRPALHFLRPPPTNPTWVCSPRLRPGSWRRPGPAGGSPSDRSGKAGWGAVLTLAPGPSAYLQLKTHNKCLCQLCRASERLNAALHLLLAARRAAVSRDNARDRCTGERRRVCSGSSRGGGEEPPLHSSVSN